MSDRWMPGGVTAPQGFLASGTWSGIKRNRRPDLALIVATTPAVAAGLFTMNRIKAAPVLLAQQHLRRGRARAILVNSGCANCLTGRQGLRDARTVASAVARQLALPLHDVLVASTGVIGRRLPVVRILRAVPRVVQRLSARGHRESAWAILTTDTHPKEAALEWSLGRTRVRLGGMAKGAGMVAPHLATMLAFFTTDVAISARLLRQALQQACEASFHRITVDGDMSTNDTVLILASGQAGNAPITRAGVAFHQFAAHLTRLAAQLAHLLVRDGEGATKVAAIRVIHARSIREAERCARQVANSPLVKTMLAGSDDNVGRIVAAVGASGVHVTPERLRVLVNGRLIVADGRQRPAPRAAVRALMRAETVHVTIDLRAGQAATQLWTCDLTEGYVRLNARYTT